MGADALNVAGFMRAVRRGDLGAVRSMTAIDPGLVRATDPSCFGATALIHAASAGSTPMVDLLLELGADIDQRSDWWAGGFGVLDGASDEMCEHLLARGATLTAHAAARLGKVDRLREMLDRDPSLVSSRGGDGQTPLHFARTIEIAMLLLSRGATIDALDVDHASTPAQWLSASRPEVAGWLVGRGAAADPFLAARIGDVDLLERLIEREIDGVNVRVTRERFPTMAPAAGHIYLYTIGEGCGLLHAAASVNQAGVIRRLAGRGAGVDARGGYDEGTPLHAAAWNDCPEAAEALIDAGAPIDVPSGPMHRNEPIGWAIVGGSVSVFRVLKRRGAAVKPHHVKDAEAGARGAFKEFKGHVPLSAWETIAREVG